MPARRKAPKRKATKKGTKKPKTVTIRISSK